MVEGSKESIYCCDQPGAAAPNMFRKRLEKFCFGTLGEIRIGI
jgi:hypothetical protein